MTLPLAAGAIKIIDPYYPPIANFLVAINSDLDKLRDFFFMQR
jgi:hypothetical protein